MIKFYLSGGAANSNPNLSLGGAISNTEIQSQLASYYNGSMPGVTLLSSFGNIQSTTGQIQLSLKIVNGIKRLIYTPYGIEAFTLSQNFDNCVVNPSNGVYNLSWSDYGVMSGISISIIASSLGGADASYGINIQNPTSNGLFDDLSESDIINSVTSFRCIYAKNTGASTVNFKLYTPKTSLSSSIYLGLDPAGAGGTAQLIANDSVIPNTVNFSFNREYDTGLSASLGSNVSYPFWIKRSAMPFFVGDGIVDDSLIVAEIR